MGVGGVVDYAVLDRVCQMYAGKVRLREISVRAGISLAQVCRYLVKARELGDVRATLRRPADSRSRGQLLREMFEASDDGFVAVDDAVEMFWPRGVERPSTWRVLVRLGVTHCRKRFGMKVEFDRGRRGYVWVRL